MDSNNIILQGEVVKFIMLVNRDDFSMSEGNFDVTLRWGMMGQEMTIAKADMVEAADGYIFTFDTNGVTGKVTADARWYYIDADVPGSIRTETDSQLIMFVAASPCPRILMCPACSGEHDVTYTRIEQSDFGAKYMRLVEAYDRSIMTRNSEYIYVLKTAE